MENMKEMIMMILQTKLVIATILVLLTSLSLKLVDKLFKLWSKKGVEDQIHWKFTENIIKAIVCIFGIYAIGIQFEPTKEIAKTILQSSSLFVAVAGFAAQQTLNDVISGFMISIYKPFNLGERINLVGLDITGIVENINLRHTVIRCFDNNRIIIPNSIINKEILKNSNLTSDGIGNYLEISIGYNSDITKAMTLMKEAILGNPLVLDVSKCNSDKELEIMIKELGQSGVILKTTVWTKDISDNFKACSDIRLKIKELFDQNGIEIPYNYIHIVTDK